MTETLREIDGWQIMSNNLGGYSMYREGEGAHLRWLPSRQRYRCSCAVRDCCHVRVLRAALLSPTWPGRAGTMYEQTLEAYLRGCTIQQLRTIQRATNCRVYGKKSTCRDLITSIIAHAALSGLTREQAKHLAEGTRR